MNIDSIIENYCVNKDKPAFQCNGKCHLATQLSKTSNKNDDDSNKPLRVIFESFIPVFITTFQEVKFNKFIDEVCKKDSFCYANGYHFLPAYKAYKPPIA